jgi:hypothetical protein
MFEHEKWPGEDEFEEIKFEEIVGLDVSDREAAQVVGGPATASGTYGCKQF